MGSHCRSSASDGLVGDERLDWDDGPSAVTFTVGPDGRATAVRIENLNGQGTFQGR